MKDGEVSVNKKEKAVLEGWQRAREKKQGVRVPKRKGSVSGRGSRLKGREKPIGKKRETENQNVMGENGTTLTAQGDF